MSGFPMLTFFKILPLPFLITWLAHVILPAFAWDIISGPCMQHPICSYCDVSSTHHFQEFHSLKVECNLINLFNYWYHIIFTYSPFPCSEKLVRKENIPVLRNISGFGQWRLWRPVVRNRHNYAQIYVLNFKTLFFFVQVFQSRYVFNIYHLWILYPISLISYTLCSHSIVWVFCL